MTILWYIGAFFLGGFLGVLIMAIIASGATAKLADERDEQD